MANVYTGKIVGRTDSIIYQATVLIRVVPNTYVILVKNCPIFSFKCRSRVGNKLLFIGEKALHLPWSERKVKLEKYFQQMQFLYKVLHLKIKREQTIWVLQHFCIFYLYVVILPYSRGNEIVDHAFDRRLTQLLKDAWGNIQYAILMCHLSNSIMVFRISWVKNEFRSSSLFECVS